MSRAKCPICERHMATFAAGDFREHGPRDNPCLGSRRTPAQAETYILPPLTDHQVDLLRNCWRVGDWRPVEMEFGITMPQYNLHGATLEEELADLINDARKWINTLVMLSKSHAERRVP